MLQSSVLVKFNFNNRIVNNSYFLNKIFSQIISHKTLEVNFSIVIRRPHPNIKEVANENTSVYMKMFFGVNSIRISTIFFLSLVSSLDLFLELSLSSCLGLALLKNIQRDLDVPWGNFSMFSLTCFKLMRRLYSGGQRGMISFHQQQNQLIQGFEKFRSKA